MGLESAVGALLRIWPDLPVLVGPDWPRLEEKLDVLFTRMADADDNERTVLASTMLLELQPYPAIRPVLRQHLDTDVRMYGLPSGVPRGDGRTWTWPSVLGEYEDVRSRAVGAPQDAEPPGPAAARRYVNTRVCEPGSGADVAQDSPLRPATRYDILVNVGARDDRSLLAAADADFPAELLPPGGLWLSVVAHAPGTSETPVQRWLYLPEEGDSFVCPCAPGSAGHACTPGQREPYAVVPLTTPAVPAPVLVRLAIYHHAAVVHVHELTLPMSAPARFAAQVIYSLTRSFSELGAFRDRTISVYTCGTAAAGRVYVNGVSAESMAFSYSDQQAENACRIARTSLFKAHLVKQDGGWASTYREHRKGQQGFEADLLALARVGRDLHASIFGRGDWPQIRETLLHEAAAGPAVVQCGRMSTERLAVPWQLVYDLPMQSGDTTPYVCPSVREIGTATSEQPGVCPHEDTHQPQGRSVLCPYGFWGLAHILEVPPHQGEENGLAHVVSDRADTPVATVIGWNPQLSPGKESKAEALRHLGALRGRLGVLPPEIERRDDLGRRLAGSDMDLVYVYGHCERSLAEGATASSAVLVLGKDEFFTPQDVKQWAGYYAWPWPHWPERKPLVVLNACHTGEIQAATLADFVNAFTETAGAAGVVSTEVTLEQGLAGFAMELFLAELANNVSVGRAMRRMRWALLARGNVMGLAYTPYCAADLSLRRAAAADNSGRKQ
ncbi:CHAT domain-containing protein [Actinoplanes sp. NPDC049548]|uniref:CHAT domain-containing protein n=1 Tax=Actinoplanes sp. NPDC049548 TaxID=3155152 RepID=UPI0034490A8F